VSKILKDAVPPAVVTDRSTRCPRRSPRSSTTCAAEATKAVRHYSERLDGYAPASFRLGRDEIRAAAAATPETVRDDIRFAQRQVRAFAECQLASLSEFETETLPGVFLGQKNIPVGASGAYVPGGRYPLLASAHMTIVTAKVAARLARQSGRQRRRSCGPGGP
jgi:sulfopropanediol 3-dehydrogenase